MSAVIVAFSSTAGRGSLVAAVSLRQAVGRSMAIRPWIRHVPWDAELCHRPRPAKVKDSIMMDMLWRLVLGLAGIPAVFEIDLHGSEGHGVTKQQRYHPT